MMAVGGLNKRCPLSMMLSVIQSRTTATMMSEHFQGEAYRLVEFC